MDNDVLKEVLTAAEAADLWNMDVSTVKKACNTNRIECRKSKGTWLVTKKGMEQLYGEMPNPIETGK